MVCITWWVTGAEAEDGPQAPVVRPADHASAENHEVSTVAERGVQVHGAGKPHCRSRGSATGKANHGGHSQGCQWHHGHQSASGVRCK